MDKKKIYIGNRTYTVEIADTEELQKRDYRVETTQLRTRECCLFIQKNSIPQNIG